MLPRNILITWVQKLIYSWLIFCLGGVGSLTYFDGFLPGHEHGQHPFHLSIFEEGDEHPDPLPPLPGQEILAQQMRLWLFSRFTPNGDFLMAASSAAPGLTQFFTSSLSDGYLLTTARFKIINLSSLFGSVALPALTGQSAWLAPPEKPPSPYLS